MVLYRWRGKGMRTRIGGGFLKASARVHRRVDSAHAAHKEVSIDRFPLRRFAWGFINYSMPACASCACKYASITLVARGLYAIGG